MSLIFGCLKRCILIRCHQFYIIALFKITHSLSFIVHLHIGKWLPLLITIIDTGTYQVLLLISVSLLRATADWWGVLRLACTWLTILTTAGTSLCLNHVRLFLESSTRALMMEIDQRARTLVCELRVNEVVLLEDILLRR